MSGEAALSVSGVTKRYGEVAALGGVTLDAPAGELLALLGHNGAGKTTLMKVLLGLTRRDAGAVQVLGADPAGQGAAALRRRVGFLPENVSFTGGMSGRETLRFFARLQGEPATAAEALLERVGLGGAARRPIRTYSKGMRQRLGLAQALIGRPRLLLLDEPTSGLDPMLRRTFYELLAELRRAGASVLLSSHVLTELELQADRVAILREGWVVAHDSLEGLRRQAGLPVRLRVVTGAGRAAQLAESLGCRVVGCNARVVELAVPPGEKMPLLRRLAALDPGTVEDIEVMPPSLEAVYAHFGGPPVQAAP